MKNDIVYITGHKNPDSDSVCSAIAYAYLKNTSGINAVPARIGKLNRETEFILERFGFEAPEYLTTVKTQISDIKMDLMDTVLPSMSIREVWLTLKEKKLGAMPVGDENHVLKGIVSVSDMANAYMDIPNEATLSESYTPVENVVKTLNARLICGKRENFRGTGKVRVAAMTPEGMNDFIGEGDIVFAGDIEANQKKAIEDGADCVILTCGSSISKEITYLAKVHDCVLLNTEYDTFTATRLIFQSLPVETVMTSNDLVLFHPDDLFDDAKEKMTNTRFRSYPVVDGDGKFLGFISRYHLLNRNRKKVILVDHNEMPQSVNGIEQAQIMEIVDHHRIGGMQTGGPIYYRNEPVGSTATIIAEMFREKMTEPPAGIAGILCGAIISDTINFKSPTSTAKDIDTASWLSEVADIDMDAFAVEMFEYSSSIKNLSVEEIVNNDFKDYDIGGSKVGIGQVNTTELRSLKKMREDILRFMKSLAGENNYNLVMLLISDIIEEETRVLFAEKGMSIVAKAFPPLLDENSFDMKGVVSRKKQIVPRLMDILQGE